MNEPTTEINPPGPGGHYAGAGQETQPHAGGVREIKGILGREPNYTELGIFSVMWSEHCSYKNTRPFAENFSHQIAPHPGGRGGGKRGDY